MLQGNREEGPIATHNRNDSCKHIERKKSGGKESIMPFKPRLKKKKLQCFNNGRKRVFWAVAMTGMGLRGTFGDCKILLISLCAA